MINYLYSVLPSWSTLVPKLFRRKKTGAKFVFFFDVTKFFLSQKSLLNII